MSRAAEKFESVVLVPVGQCHKSPTQPRRRGAGERLDADFVASVAQKGVLQPIVVRARKAGGWEIVFGHRRHAASVVAKLETIPAIAREMSDDDAFEAQMVENVHREDMHPLDEADGFKRMMDRGKTAAQIAEKVGRNVSYVAQRLKLVDLAPAVRKALDKEEISLGVAMLVARIPTVLQSEVTKTFWSGIGVAEVKKILETTFLLRLDQAPFDVADAALVPKAGACTSCPKRTGQQRELFSDVARADMCIDRACYHTKLDAVWQLRKKEADAGGAPVLEGKAAERATGYGGGYKKLDDQEWAGSKLVKVRALFGKDLPPVTLARDERTGAIHELVKSADVDKVLKRRPEPASSRAGDQRRQDQREKQRAAAVNLAIAAATTRVSRVADSRLVALLTHALVKRSCNDVQTAVFRRRGVDAKGGAEEKLLGHLGRMKKAVDVAGLGLELALRAVGPHKFSPAHKLWGETLKSVGVDFAAIERQVAAEKKAKKTTKGKAAAAK